MNRALEARNKLTTLRGIAALGKVEQAIDWTRAYLLTAPGEVALLGMSLKPLEALWARLTDETVFPGLKPVKCFGRWTNRTVEELRAFNQDPTRRVIVATLKTTFGQHLFSATDALGIIEYSWEPHENQRAVETVEGGPFRKASPHTRTLGIVVRG